MRFNLRGIPPEILIAGTSLAVMLFLSSVYSLPIIWPSSGGAAFVGIHYLYPLVGVAILGLATFVAGNRDVATSFIVALPCYIIILFVHFNIKLWIPHINPASFDEFYWSSDLVVHPLVDVCMHIRTSLSGIISFSSNFYMISFIGLFYISFLYHAIKTPEHFRALVVSVLLLQFLGALTYLVAPAIGPFIYEKGVDPTITAGQQSMLHFYNNSVAHGPAWIAQHGKANFAIGLAAMPSLHVAGAFLFFLFAWRHARILLPLYSAILFFILVTSIASRWHYVIDVPVGIVLAWSCAWLAQRITVDIESKTTNSSAERMPIAV